MMFSYGFNKWYGIFQNDIYIYIFMYIHIYIYWYAKNKLMASLYLIDLIYIYIWSCCCVSMPLTFVHQVAACSARIVMYHPARSWDFKHRNFHASSDSKKHHDLFGKLPHLRNDGFVMVFCCDLCSFAYQFNATWIWMLCPLPWKNMSSSKIQNCRA